jgi:hypothetical protein
MAVCAMTVAAVRRRMLSTSVDAFSSAPGLATREEFP